jgi:serine/threonine protein kinase
LASQKDIELASLLYRNGLATQEQIQGALSIQSKLLTQGTVRPLVDLLVEEGLLPEESRESFSETPLETLQPFPDYRLERRIGDGASSRVYRGVYLPRNLPVAVKVLHPELALQAKPMRRFQREAHLLCKLRHENIIRGYECRKIRGFRFLSMEYVHGGTVLERVDKRGPFEIPTALHVIRQVARALGYLYSLGIVHRDIKPGNILIDDVWNAKLIDLGLCRIPGASEESEGTTVGTVGYISPEQAKGVFDLDIRSDIYSLGVTLYHMICGEVPFAGENDLEVMSKQILQNLRSDRLKTLNIAPYVHYVIEKMMAKDRDLRFQHPDDVAKDLDGYLASVGFQLIPLARPVTDAPQSQPLPGKKSSGVKPAAPVSRRRRR